jgi:hypothetical protein
MKISESRGLFLKSQNCLFVKAFGFAFLGKLSSAIQGQMIFQKCPNLSDEMSQTWFILCYFEWLLEEKILHQVRTRANRKAKFNLIPTLRITRMRSLLNISSDRVQRLLKPTRLQGHDYQREKIFLMIFICGQLEPEENDSFRCLGLPDHAGLIFFTYEHFPN